MRSVEHYPVESVVLVKGQVRKAPQKIKNATLHDAEILVYEIHLISKLTENVPFSVYDAENITKYADESTDEEGEEDRRKSMNLSRKSLSSPRASMHSPRDSVSFADDNSESLDNRRSSE